MASLDLLSAGFDSIRQGQYRATTVAGEIARAGVPASSTAASSISLQAATGQPVASTQVDSNRPVDLVSNMVELQQAQTQAEVGASMIDTANEALGSLIDVLA